jgi:hypothetical protein
VDQPRVKSNGCRESKGEEVRFASDSSLEESGFEPSVPRKTDDAPRLPFSRLRHSRSAGEKGDNRLWQLLALAASARG